MGSRVWGAGCKVWGLGCGVKGARCRVRGLGSRVWGAGCEVWGQAAAASCGRGQVGEYDLPALVIYPAVRQCPPPILPPHAHPSTLHLSSAPSLSLSLPPVPCPTSPPAVLLLPSPARLIALMGRPQIVVTSSMGVLIAAGLLVGFGTRLGGGCTSGHGVCGLARLSRRSMVATALFMLSAAVTVFVARHVIGG